MCARHFQALALLTATSIVPRESSDDLVERCTGVMMEYRRKLEAISLDMKVSTSAMDGSVMVPAPAHGGDNGDGNHGDNLDVFVVLRCAVPLPVYFIFLLMVSTWLTIHHKGMSIIF